MQYGVKVKQKIDIRVRLLFLIVLSIAVLILKSEMAMLVCLLLAFVWVSINTNIGTAIPYLIIYSVLWGLLYLLKDTRNWGNLLLLTVYVRRLLIPVMMANPIVHAPTGQLIAALCKLRIPKAATLSLAVLFRFMPTIIQEYHAIRESQKFRGIGVSIGKTIITLPKTLECILVPMLIRTSKVADELTASAQVRGVKLGSECSSYHLIQMRLADWCSLILGIAVIIAVLIFDAGIA